MTQAARAAFVPGTPLPTIAITLNAEGNEQVSRFAFDEDGSVRTIEDGIWSPEDPAEATEDALLEFAWSDGRTDTLVLSGDEWRDLECFGLLEDFLLAIPVTGDMSAALALTLARVPSGS